MPEGVRLDGEEGAGGGMAAVEVLLGLEGGGCSDLGFDGLLVVAFDALGFDVEVLIFLAGGGLASFTSSSSSSLSRVRFRRVVFLPLRVGAS